LWDIGPDLNMNTTSLIKPNHLLAVLAGMLIASFVVFAPVLAQGDAEEPIPGYRILGESEAGPHTIQLQVSPVAPIQGISRFAVRIRDTATGEDVNDAKVSILAAPSEKGEAQYSLVLNSPADITYYLAQLDMETSGVWAVEVIAESDLGAGTTIMSVLVSDRARSGTGNGWGQALFALVSLSFVVGIGWVWYQSKQALKRRDQQQ
jgi:hypothetical protein